MEPAEPQTMHSLFRSADPQSVCILALLTWVASCDGTVRDEELALIRSVAAGLPGAGGVLPDVIDVAMRGRAEDLELACRYLRNHFPRARRPRLAQLFITMAVQDGHLTVAENHVLRFLSDLLGLAPRKFAKLFEQVAHRPFPEVGDVSSPEWWRRREAGEQAQAPPGGWGQERPDASAKATFNPAGGAAAAGASAAGSTSQPPPPTKGKMTRAQALALLALTEGASTDEIHSAYRRMAKARHPDRFARLGPAAQAAAAAAFQLVHDAYEVLTAA